MTTLNALAESLFARSVTKQQKYEAVTSLMGPTDGLRCLDVGADNGVLSYKLRQRGGRWTSADGDANTCEAIRSLVHEDVVYLDGERTPFAEAEFDRVLILDYLEHIKEDRAFVEELRRIIRPDGVLVVNVPRLNNGLIRRLRHALGQTDEQHGHVRPGYDLTTLRTLFAGCFEIEATTTYSRFFTELIDTLIVWATTRLQGGPKQGVRKGQVVTLEEVRQHHKRFQMYQLVYPVLKLTALADRVLFFTPGNLLVVRARPSQRKTPPGENEQQLVANMERITLGQ